MSPQSHKNRTVYSRGSASSQSTAIGAGTVSTGVPGRSALAKHGRAWATLACLVALGCSDPPGDGGKADAGSTGGTKLPAKCTAGPGNIQIEFIANLQVFQEAKKLSSAGVVTIASGGTSAGQKLDTPFKVINGANAASARELRITSVEVVYATPAGVSEPGSPFECLVESAGALVPCKGHVFGAVVPEGFDPDCVSNKAVGARTDQQVIVRYTKPVDSSPRVAELRIVTEGDTDFAGKPFLVSLAATVGSAKIAVSPTTVDFGTVKLGEKKPAEFKITNVGDAPLQVAKLDLALDDAKPFAAEVEGKACAGGKTCTFDPPLTLAKGKTIAVKLTFTGVDGAGHISSAMVYSSDPSQPAVKVKLVANQNIPCLKVVPSAVVNFGSVQVGKLGTKQVCLSSCGTAPVDITDLQLADTSGAFGMDLAGLKLGGKAISKENPLGVGLNGNACFDVTCEPESENKDASGKALPFQASLKLDDNTIQPTKSLKLECYGSATDCPTPILEVSAEQIVPQDKLQLKASQSQATGGKSIEKYKWSVVKLPPGAQGLKFFPDDTKAVVFFGAETVNKLTKKTEVSINVAGEYVFQLKVTDNAGVAGCLTAETTVLVIPDEAIHVELLWDTPGDANKTDTGLDAGSDLDLHFTHPMASKGTACSEGKLCNGKLCPCQPDLDKDGSNDPFFHGQFDCYWYNSSPNWASVTDAADDNPGLDLDDTDGLGPENLNLFAPENVNYTVGVHAWDEHGYGESTATVNIYILGALKGTYVKKLQECDLWWVKVISWPAGDLLDVAGGSGNGKVTANYKSAIAAGLGGKCK